MYMPYCALDSNTLIRFEVLKKPHLRCLLHRTSEMMTTLASSPLEDVVSCILWRLTQKDDLLKVVDCGQTQRLQQGTLVHT